MFYVADMLLFVLTTKIIYMFPVVLLFVCGGGLAGGDVQYCRSINTIYFFFFLSMDPITVLTVFMAFAMMFGIGYFMSAMAAIEEEQLREKQPRQYKPRPPSR